MNGVRNMTDEQLEAAFVRADNLNAVAVKQMIVREVIRRTAQALRAA
jgi:hypothetical protein